MLTCEFSAKVTHVGLPSLYLSIFFLVATKPIKLKFDTEHWLHDINGSHAYIRSKRKNTFENRLTKGSKTLRLACSIVDTLYIGPYDVWLANDPMLTLAYKVMVKCVSKYFYMGDLNMRPFDNCCQSQRHNLTW